MNYKECYSIVAVFTCDMCLAEKKANMVFDGEKLVYQGKNPFLEDVWSVAYLGPEDSYHLCSSCFEKVRKFIEDGDKTNCAYYWQRKCEEAEAEVSKMQASLARGNSCS